MVRKSINEVLARGEVGFIWEVPAAGAPPDLDGDDCSRGDIELTAERDIRVRMLEEDVQRTLNVQKDPIPAALLALTPEGLFALHGISHRSANRHLMGARASTRSYRCRTAVELLDVEGVGAELRPRQMSAVFAGRRVAEWAGQLGMTEDRTTDKGRLREVTIRLGSAPSENIALSAGRELVSSAYWGVRSRGAEEVIDVGWELTTRCVARPQRPDALLTPLWRTQELLSLAFGGIVMASMGRARYVDTEELRALWDATLMTHEPQVQPSELTAPSFTLADLGGFAAVRRWVTLCADYPRAVQPIIARIRYTATSAETQLLELGGAIHHWVKAHARTAKWADTTKKTGKIHEAALGHRVGPAFAGLVGDIDRWAGVFRNYYDSLRHRPAFSPDPVRLGLLVWSGHLLLEAALLHRIGQGKRAGNRHLENPRHGQTSARLRRDLDT